MTTGSLIRSRSCRHRARKGYTLLEMLIVISLLGGMIGGTMTLLSVVRVHEQQSIASVTVRRDIARLADDLRRDVADCDSVTVAEMRLILESADGATTVEYEWESGTESSNDRIMRRVESDASSRSRSRERYHLGVGRPVSVRWNVATGHLTWAMGEYKIVAVRNP